MCKVKKMSSTEEEDDSPDDLDMTVSSDDSDESEVEESQQATSSTSQVQSADGDEEEEEDDDLVKAIKAAKEKTREHPPEINFEDLIIDISFHPDDNVLAAASVVGDVFLYRYSNESNELLQSLELHTKACRDVEFNADGSILYSCGKDKSIMLTDTKTGKLRQFYDNAHEEPLYSLYVIKENIFCTGDENGTVKIWDIRQSTPVVSFKEMEDFVSDMVTNEAKKYLVCTSGDGSITTYNMTARKLYVQSEEYDVEFNCIKLFRQDTKLLTGTSKGTMYMFNWGEFGLHTDEYIGSKHAINSILALTDNIALAAYDDGKIGAVNLFPNRCLGVVGQHEVSVEAMDISHDGEFVASSGLDNIVKFWNIKYFEDVHVRKEKLNKMKKKKDLEHNLPSSKMKNASDFFSDLA